uniref:Retrovirus-related Pol polyprotein from transposon 297 family n=1 Tax=Cajanus cajan TaxID=3821 RepID=A0A151THM3_CAJCA|nr:Retrovirus-related Pol polyprotein from transposon 297 family [Cajanus cajan]
MSSPVTSDSKINTSASISRKEVSDRIAKGLCRFCGDKWDKNHKMKCKVWGKLNAIFSAQEEIAEDIMQDKDCEEEQAIVDRSIAMIQDEEVHISLNALQGIAGGNTLQLKGLIKHQKVPFLMDTGSTHNFISDKWVKVLGLKTQFVKDFPVTVASDKKLLITRKCEQTTWRFSDHTFTADFLVLPSKTFGIILGMQWFKTLGEIYWNCATLTMRFNHQGQEVTLQGEQPSAEVQELTGKLKMVQSSCMFLALHGSALLNVADTGDQETLTTEQQQELTTLLQQFQQLFVEPTKLPPRRKSYYRRFILNYGKIAAPLTELLKKEKAFKWTEETAVAFQKLKQALMSAPVLRLPDFKQPFTIETDASGGGIGAVLLQNGHPIAIEYKKGKENVVADTLSRVGQNASVAAILHFSSRLMTEAIESWKTDPKLHKLVDKIRLTQQPYKHYTFQGVLLKRKGKVVVGAQQDLRNKILSHFHDSSIGGHSGVDLTYRRIKEQFYWKGLQRDVKRWIRECATCQRFK